jgi:collagenase-like PrtC family protease
MSSWVIPYIDQDLSFWQEIDCQYGKQIHSVYLPMPSKLVASGRAPQPEQNLGAFLREAPLKKTVLINPIVLDQPAEEVAPKLINALRQLWEDYGVEHVTTGNLTLARLIRTAIPEMKISASTLMGISTPAQVLMAQDWIDTLIPDTRLLRDLPGLERLRRVFKGEMRLIVNEACLPGCLQRTQHFYEMAYSEFHPQSLCRSMLTDRPWLRLTGAWVLPQHLHLYDGLYDSLKLAGRVTLKDPAKYRQVLEAYILRQAMNPRDIGGGPASPLEALEITEAWFEHTLRCSKECTNCTVCRDYYTQALQKTELSNHAN